MNISALTLIGSASCALTMAVASSSNNDTRTAESLIRDLDRLRGVPCAGCRAPLCPHQVLMSIALGFMDAPRCLPCFGTALDRDPARLRDSLFDYIRQRECYWDAWNRASREAGLPEGSMPPALQSPGSASIPAGVPWVEDLAGKDASAPQFMGRKNLQHLDANRSHEPHLPLTRPSGTLSPTGGEGWGEGAHRFMERGPFQPDAEWNAGDMGCGELVLELRLRLEAMSSGQIFKLCARDTGAPEDLPAWCRLTGHRLLRAEPPTYWIQRKE